MKAPPRKPSARNWAVWPMLGLLSIARAGATVAAPNNIQPASAGVRTIESLRGCFAAPPTGSGTTTLWWLNGKLTKAEIREQLLNLRDKDGFGGVAPLPMLRKGVPTEPAYLSVEGKEHCFGNRDFAYIHRSVPGAEVYFFSNSSGLDVKADVTLRGRMKLELWDPHTGTMERLESTPAEEQGQQVSRFELKLASIRSVFVVGR